MALYHEISHLYGEDLPLSPTGDLAMVSGSDRTMQRVIRRLLTAATDDVSSDYPFAPLFGVGLGKRIGQTLDVRGLQAIVLSQLLLEASVARLPLPVVTINPLPGNSGAVISVTYVDNTGTEQAFNFALRQAGA